MRKDSETVPVDLLTVSAQVATSLRCSSELQPTCSNNDIDVQQKPT